MKQVILIENMSCQNCAKHVTEHLRELAGINQVEVRLEEKLVRIETSQEHSLQEYQVAFEDTIYEVISLN